MLRFVVVFYLFMLSSSLFAQNVDSLRNVVEKDSNVNNRINALNQLSQIYLADSADEALIFAKKALILSQENGDKMQEAVSTDNIALALYMKHDYTQAIRLFEESSQIYNILHQTEQISVDYNRIGVIYHITGIYDKALEYLLKSIKLAKEADNKSRIAQVYNNLGLVYKDMGQTDQAFETFQKALSVSKQLNDNMLIAYTLNNIGIIYKVLMKYDKAIEYYQQSVDLKTESGDLKSIANSIGNIGEAYYFKNDFKKAIEYFDKVKEISVTAKDNYIICVNFLNYGKVYMKMKNFRDSEGSLKEAYDLSLEYEYNDLRKEILLAFSELFESMNNPARSLKYYKDYASLKDSLLNESKNRLMIQTVAAYQIDKTQRENEILRYKSNLDEEKISSGRTSLILLIAFVAALCVILFLIYKRLKEDRRRSNLIADKNEQIEKINEELSTLNNELEKHVLNRTNELTNQISDKEDTLKKLEIALKEAEKANGLKDTFLSNINHEIRTPLSAIMGLTDVLKTKLSNQELLSYLDGIHQSSNRLNSLLNNIIDFSRLQTNDLSLSFTSCDVNSIVSNATELFRFKANEKHLALDLFLGNVPKVYADVTFLSKVVSDIIDNAVKYTNTGGIEIHTAFLINQNEVQIKIVDTGIGIDENYLPHIFETFRQESTGYARLYEGAGLGLPLARRLINMMNGRLEVSSRKGKGTTITIILNSEKDSGPESKTISYDSVQISDSKFDPSNYYSLIIEDDPFNALFISAILEGLSQVTIAENGEQALQIIRDMNDSKNNIFNIVLIDINLPGNWDGVALMKKIKEDFPRYQAVPFVAQTAYSLNTEHFHLTDAGFNETIVKPIDSVKLKNIVKKYLLKK